jgi:serine/threonine protein kinase
MDASPSQLYLLGCEIGRGSYGRVYRATRIADGLPVAVKMLPTDTDDEVTSLTAEVCREVESLRRCKSEHVLRYLASHSLVSELWIVTELCDAGR